MPNKVAQSAGRTSEDWQTQKLAEIRCAGAVYCEKLGSILRYAESVSSGRSCWDPDRLPPETEICPMPLRVLPRLKKGASHRC